MHSALFLEEFNCHSSDGGNTKTTTAETSPTNSNALSQESFNIMMFNSIKRQSQTEDLNLEVAKQIALGLHEQVKLPHLDTK